MPSSFHTKTIEQILDPVAQQVSELVVLHEKGEDGAAMPNLQNQINAVNAAVTNLATVGQQQVETSRDEVLKIDTPPALNKLVTSSSLLVDATNLLTSDAYSKQGREKLISGARGILQGTSDVLLIFDAAEVRRICVSCQNVRDYLKVSEVVQGMPDLVTYVKSLTPGMTNMTKMVSERAGDLTNQLHADKLEECIKHLREQLPNFLSSIKLVVSTVESGGKAHQSATDNRLYYVGNLSHLITEMIRYLQMVSSDHEMQTDPMHLNALNRRHEAMGANVAAGRSWLADPNADPDSMDKLALAQALDSAREIGKAAGNDKLVGDADRIGKKMERLAQLRREGKGGSPEARQLAREIDAEVSALQRDVDSTVAQLNQLGQAYDAVAKRMPAAKEWLADPNAKPGAGSADIGAITSTARDLMRSLPADRCTARERADMMDLCDEIDAMMGKLEGYRERGEGQSVEARQLAKQVGDKLSQLEGKMAKILTRHAAPQTLQAKIEKAKKWLEAGALMGEEGAEEGMSCARAIIGEARNLARSIHDPATRDAMTKQIDACQRALERIEAANAAGDARGAAEAAGELREGLEALTGMMKSAMAALVADQFADPSLALKQLNAAALAPPNAPNRDETYEAKARSLEDQSERLTKLGVEAVAQSQFGAADKVKEVELTSKKVKDLTAQVITAGRIVLQHPDNALAKQHFKALQDEWTENMNRLTEQVDDTVDVCDFLRSSERGMAREKAKCETAMEADDVIEALNTAGNMAKRAQRVVQAGKREVENREGDPTYTSELKVNLKKLDGVVPHFVNATRGYVQSRGQDPQAKQAVKGKMDELMYAVSDVRTTVEARLIEEQMMNLPPPPPPPPAEEEEAPPQVPPLPQEEQAPQVPPLPAPEDADAEEFFGEGADEQSGAAGAGGREETMMKAAKELHDEAKQWESQGNNIIAAAKRMAVLMAKMSSLVGNSNGKKSELISCAKEIAKASAEVTKLAKEVANKCTDKRIRTDMMKTLERIPTISTQLRILSTVKAASLGDNSGTTEQDEDAASQATELLVHNAQNLMMSVKDTVKYAEAASIRIRTDAGVKMRWVRKTS